MNNKLSSTLDRRSERRNKVMSRVLKVDSNNPSTFLAEVKQIMNIEEGAQVEVEKVGNGFLFKPATTKPEGIKSPLASPYISLDEQARRCVTAATEMQSLGIPEDSNSLDSDWWTEILKTRPEQLPKDFSLDD